MKVKQLRSVIAFLLCATLVFSFCIKANAQESVRITSIDLVDADAIVFYENCMGEWRESYNARTGQTETYFAYDINFWNSDYEIRIGYSDGTSEIMPLSDFMTQGNGDIWYQDAQDIHHWAKDGDDNYFLIGYPGGRVMMPVQIVDSPVASIEIVRLEWENGEQIETAVDSLELVENAGGSWVEEPDSSGTMVNYYRYENFNGLSFKITYTDGKDPYYASSGEIVPGFSDHVRVGENQADNPWVADGKNVLTVEYMGVSTGIPVFLIENPVASIEPVEGATLHLIENTGGRQDTYYDDQIHDQVNYYRYDVYGDDIEIIIHYNDPSREDRIAHLFERVDGEEVRYRDEQGRNPWLAENDDNLLIVEYMGKTAEIPVVFDENPVDSIEILDTENNPIKVLTLVENTDGDEDRYYDRENDCNVSFFRYNIDRSKIHVLVHYTDGTERIAYPHEDIAGYHVQAGDDQQNDPWEKDKENILTVEFMGKSASIPVTIIENPVDHIEILEGSELHFVQNTNGHTESVFNDSLGEWDEYYRYDIEKEAVQIKIYYTDESREPVTAYLYDRIDGYEVKTMDNQPWAPESENRLAVEYMGKWQEITVIFDENPVDHIEIVGADSYTVIENFDGAYETRGLQDGTEEEYYRYNIHQNAFSVKIVYNNGEEYIAEPFEMVNGFRVDAGRDQQDAPWRYRGDNRMTVEYLGRTAELPVLVLSGDVNRDGSTDVLDIIRLTKRLEDGVYEERADVDQDGDVDEDDMTILRQILNQTAPGEEPIDFSSDINGDGESNVLDIIRLKKIIVSGEYHEEGDLNHDGRLDAEDLSLLFQSLL